MTLTQNVKKEARKAGFVAVGVSNLNMLRELPFPPASKAPIKCSQHIYNITIKVLKKRKHQL
jgi:hypothetical protein